MAGSRCVHRNGGEASLFEEKDVVNAWPLLSHRLQPGWVLRKDNVQEITAPLQAVQLVMDTLGLPYP